jgi:ABC-type nitrate/sulfonate/bicarbonate transport system permease component
MMDSMQVAASPDASAIDERLEAAPPSRRRSLGGRKLEPVLVLVAVLLALEAGSRSGVLPTQDVPPVSVVLAAFVRDLVQQKIWAAAADSLVAWAVGMGAVILLALPAGMLMGASRRVHGSTIFTMEFVRMIPSLAALPLLIFVYGIGLHLTVMLVVLASLWPLLLQTMYGMRDVDPVLHATGRVYGLDARQRLMLITLPSVAPYVATGLRISATTALVVAIAVSLVVGGDGLGGLIGSAAQGGQIPLMYARILATGLLGLALTQCLQALERRVLHWHVAHRGAFQ